MKNFILFALLIGFLGACVPTNKRILLQSDEGEDRSKQEKKITQVDFDYKLLPGDVVSINVSSLTASEYNVLSSLETRQNEKLDPLLTGFLIGKDGNIVLPHIGDVQIKGLTVKEAQEKIKGLVAALLNNPTVYVRLVSFDFSILGEVKTQGKYSIYDGQINILEAIGKGGGLSDFADGENIKIVRTVNNVSTIAIVNVLKEDVIASPYYYIHPNDVIMVPPLKTKNFRQNQSSNLSLIFTGLATIASVVLVYVNVNNLKK